MSVVKGGIFFLLLLASFHQSVSLKAFRSADADSQEHTVE